MTSMAWRWAVALALLSRVALGIQVIVAGLGRTGTMSMLTALQTLGTLANKEQMVKPASFRRRFPNKRNPQHV